MGTHCPRDTSSKGRIFLGKTIGNGLTLHLRVYIGAIDTCETSHYILEDRKKKRVSKHNSVLSLLPVSPKLTGVSSLLEKNQRRL
jgi:hypothetical protein